MKVCTCGNSKWKTLWETKEAQCLYCYKKFKFSQLKRLKDRKERS